MANASANTSHELFLSWRHGWRDGTHARIKQNRFTRHARQDIREAYALGYEEGTRDRCAAQQRAMDRYQYEPSILR